MDTALRSSPVHPSYKLLIEEGCDYTLESTEQLPYKSIEILGYGLTSLVEKVEDIHTGSIYARKIMRIRERRKREEKLQMLHNEVKILRKLDHQHFVRLFATYATKREVGLIQQPAASDGDLDSFLDSFTSADRRDPVKGTTLKHAFGCLASGLAFLHEQRIRHKDIKPSNILIHRGKVLYTDFGFSLDSSLLGCSTTTGKPEGFTRRYAAPEVLEYEPRDSKSDVYSLGCVYLEIFSALTGISEVDAERCYSEEMEAIHSCLKRSRTRKAASFLKQLSLAMTAPDPASRPTAVEVQAWFLLDAGFFCGVCMVSAFRSIMQLSACGIWYRIMQMNLRLSQAYQNLDSANIDLPNGIDAARKNFVLNDENLGAVESIGKKYVVFLKNLVSAREMEAMLEEISTFRSALDLANDVLCGIEEIISE